MAALTDSLSSPAPQQAARELTDYPQFVPCGVPVNSGAEWAYRGFIRPFSDDATAQRVFRAIENGAPLQVYGGRLDAEENELHSHPHPIDEFLIDMFTPFNVLLLEFPGTEHPRTLLLDPLMTPRVSECRHLRTDKSVKIDGRSLSALCVYSGSLQKFECGRSRAEQLLDQTATYLAKYLVWLRTRRLYRRIPGGLRLVKAGAPNGKITTAEIDRDPNMFWEGYWPGKSAPSGPAAHLATIKAEDECWCWSGDKYGRCCRPKEFGLMRDFERRRICSEFVRKLMAAIHSESIGHTARYVDPS
jgi:hypothetical protein